MIDAHWIWTKKNFEMDVQTGLFRRTFSTNLKSLTFRLSADTRYRVWWNGELLGCGPWTGDMAHWSYETYTVVPKKGKNCLAVEVLFQGQYEQVKLVNYRPAMLCWSDDEAVNALVASGDQWKCFESKFRAAHPVTSEEVFAGQNYTALGALEAADGRLACAGWQQPTFPDAKWKKPVCLPEATHFRNQSGVQGNSWELVDPAMPQLTRTPMPWKSVLRAGTLKRTPNDRIIDGPAEVSLLPTPKFDAKKGLVNWSATDSQYIIIDAGVMTTAFLELDLEGDENSPPATVTLRYAEALSVGKIEKERRDEKGTGTVQGYFDTYTLRKGKQTYEPFHWRAFRFLRIETTGAVKIRGLRLFQCTYPGKVIAKFDAGDKTLDKIWEVSWRTAQCDAHETHDDCPYYEQLPYVQDMRLHGPIGMMFTGDRRLFERSIRAYSWTLRNDGMIVTRHPARTPQIITSFSLIWIQLVEDFYQMTGDKQFVADMWMAVEGILTWFKEREDAKTIFKLPVPYWNFLDWSLPGETTTAISGGAPPPVLPAEFKCNAGNYAGLAMFYVGALKSAAALAPVVGRDAKPFAARYAKLKASIRAKLWDPKQALMRDNPTRKELIAGQQTVLAILADVLTPQESHKAFTQILARKDLCQATTPFAYYVFRAASKLGRYDEAWKEKFNLWTDMLALGATTWFENPVPSRSDCHAWSSWIVRDYFTEILGIQILEPGYKKVLIRPRPLHYTKASGQLPTAAGMVSVSWEIAEVGCRTSDVAKNRSDNRQPTTDSQMTATVTLPESCDGGFFEFPDGKRVALKRGANVVAR